MHKNFLVDRNFSIVNLTHAMRVCVCVCVCVCESFLIKV